MPKRRRWEPGQCAAHQISPKTCRNKAVAVRVAKDGRKIVLCKRHDAICGWLGPHADPGDKEAMAMMGSVVS